MTMRAHKVNKFALLAALLLVAAFSSSAQEAHIGKLDGHSDSGKQLFYRYCWACHGFRGDGNGENAPYLNILPRNLVAATFKCRSTPTGTCRPTRIFSTPSLGDSTQPTCLPGSL